MHLHVAVGHPEGDGSLTRTRSAAAHISELHNNNNNRLNYVKCGDDLFYKYILYYITIMQIIY